MTALDHHPAPSGGSAAIDPATTAPGARRGRQRGHGRHHLRGRRLPRRGPWPGVLLLAALFVVAFAGPALSRWAWTDVDFTAYREPPSARHWFGTTAGGRDVYALVLHGLRKSLVIGLGAAFLATALAAVVGAVAGLAGGPAGRVLMAITDLLLVLPAFLVIALLSPVLRTHWLLIVPMLAGLMWMITARMVRAATLSMRERDYVTAARFMGAGTWWILRRHVLPGLAPLLIVDVTLNVGVAVMAESGLSYFGFGVQAPDRSLGSLIAEGAESATTYPWTFCFSAGALVLLVLSVNLIGEGLRDRAAAPGDGADR